MEIECKNCEKTFLNRRRFGRHCKITGHENYFVTEWKCKFCNTHIKEKAQRGIHTALCKLNPKRKETIRKQHETRLKTPISEKTKKKISESRRKYLMENPDKVPYLQNHSSRRSYPEILLEEELKKRNVKGWISSYRNSIYEYDFAFPDLKIDIEVDGSTHKQEKVIEKDRIRDEWSKSKGWKILRFSAKEVKENVKEVIDKIIVFINNANVAQR